MIVSNLYQNLYMDGFHLIFALASPLLLILIKLCGGLAELDVSSDPDRVAIFVAAAGRDQVDEIAISHGYKNLGQIGGLEGYYLFEHKENGRVKREQAIQNLSYDKRIEWYEPQRVLKRVKRQVEWNDPLYSDQWYLASNDTTMYVKEAWTLGYSGRGVVVTIVDDGIHGRHPDLAQNYDKEASYDFNDFDSNPMPRNNGDNQHGTRCAGEVAAVAGNRICGVGVAHRSRIGGIRVLDGDITDALEAASLSFQQQHIDIYVSSWGPPDDGSSVDGPGYLAKEAFYKGITEGRHGKGNIFVWASGNGRPGGDSCSCDGYTTSIYTVTIGSVSARNKIPWYLEECPSIMAVTYSSGGGSLPSVITTDYPSGCSTQHSGTSASAPLAAGIIALALQANRDLSWRDVQHLIVRTSNPAPLTKVPGWTKNSAGRQVSTKFGYGLMNAEAMVRLAKDWVTVPSQMSCSTHLRLSPIERLLDGIFDRKFEINFDGCPRFGPLNHLEHVQLYVYLRYKDRGDLEIVLTSPRGTRTVMLQPRPNDEGAGNSFLTWPFLSVQQWGEDPIGTWTIEVRNTGSKYNSGFIRGFTILAYGTILPPPYDLAHPSSTVDFRS